MLTAEQLEITRLELALNDAGIANKKLKQRNAELESMLVEVNNNRTGVSPCARLCESLAAKKMFDNLQRERDEFAAQVERLTRITFDVVCASAILGVPIHEEEIHKCLAARDSEIKAQAFEDGGSAQKAFWDGFERGAINGAANIRTHWNEYLQLRRQAKAGE